jgi:hypothetical protein
MEERLDNIYIYLWEDYNTVYVGRTINPKSRHYAHKYRKSERTYKFSYEHNVEHPKMIILESNLNIEDGIKQEKFWIDYYRNKTNYNVLNMTEGGQVGNIHRVYTNEELKEKIKEYQKKYQKKYYRQNKEKIKEKIKEYHRQNKERKKEYDKEWYEKNKERKKAYDKKYQKEWYEKNKERKKAYDDEHKEIKKAHRIERKKKSATHSS